MMGFGPRTLMSPHLRGTEYKWFFPMFYFLVSGCLSYMLLGQGV